MYRDETNLAAAYQLSLDYACKQSDFMGSRCIAVKSRLVSGRRELSDKPFFFSVATMGNSAVASVDEKLLPFAKEIIGKYEKEPASQLFTGKVRYLIDCELAKYNKVIGGVNIHYLPRLPYKARMPQGFEMRVYEHNDIISCLYGLDKFENALLYDDTKKRRDMLAVCAINAGKIIAMAGASSDSEKFWQIGIDVLNGYRGMGIGAALVGQLANEVFAAGAIPYYGTWDGNISSQNVALSCGFYPAWAEMYSMDISK